MTRTIKFPTRERDITDVANECARRVLQLEAGPIREVARAAARKAPIRLRFDDVAAPTSEAVDAMRLEGRVLDALRAELGEEAFVKAKSRAMMKIDDALIRASNEIANEAIEDRIRALSAADGTLIEEPFVTDS